LANTIVDRSFSKIVFKKMFHEFTATAKGIIKELSGCKRQKLSQASEILGF
jgi:hypothetical protein